MIESGRSLRRHTIEGQRMLEKIGGFMREIGGIVRASHERWDGTGYPDGLSGNSIPIEARIISACDAFNAMTTTRAYRKAMPLSSAIAELNDCSGSQFDPGVVRALLRVLAGPKDAHRLNEPTHELGLVGAPQAVRDPGPPPMVRA